MSTASDAFAAQLLVLTEALRAACNDPADALRLLSDLATFAADPIATAAPIGAAIAALQTAIAAQCRRAALISLARACAAYQPSSADDAAAVLDSVVALFDSEIYVAADAGEGKTYLALRNLRAAVIADLSSRGAQLPGLVTVTTAAPEPSLALAYRLYRDATRADELTARSGAEASMFLPTSFRALSA